MIELIPMKLLDEAQETERSYAGNHDVIMKAWERSDAVGSRYYAARSAAGMSDE